MRAGARKHGARADSKKTKLCLPTERLNKRPSTHHHPSKHPPTHLERVICDEPAGVVVQGSRAAAGQVSCAMQGKHVFHSHVSRIDEQAVAQRVAHLQAGWEKGRQMCN